MARTELVIKIPKFIYSQILKCNVSKKTIAHIFKNGIPLDTHDEEIIKETVESIWGKPPYTEVLDKIRAEIDRQERWLLQVGYTAYNINIAFDSIKHMIAESEERNDC